MPKRPIHSKFIYPSVALLAPLVFVEQADARPFGFAGDCGGCHYGMIDEQTETPPPTVGATVSVDELMAGGETEFTVTVTRSWMDATVAGFLILAKEGSEFTPSDADTHLVGLAADMPLKHAIGHSKARAFEGDTASFKAKWVAPAEVGTYDFQVFAVTSNDGDGMDEEGISEEVDDSVGSTEVSVGVGCTLTTYFEDVDGDGFGNREKRACEMPAGFVAEGGDCDDDSAEVNPAAMELCSVRDENCDGEPNSPLALYADLDGDGFGAISDGFNFESCVLLEGFSENPDDCDPTDPAIYPGAVEIINGVDDNCNAMIDEASPAGGGGGPNPTGTGAPPPDTPQAGMPPLAPAAPTAAAADGGCAVSPGRSQSLSGVAWLLAPLWVATRVRRKRRRSAARL